MGDDAPVEAAESAADGEHEQSSDLEQLHAKVAELEADAERLAGENDDLRRENRLLLGGYQAGGGLAALVLLGPGLVRAARNYFERAKPGEPVPPRESADLFAAIVRRVVAVGVLGLLVAAVPMLLLWRQNGLIADQNEYFQDQNSKIQGQLLAQAREAKSQAEAIRKQEEDTLLVRKNELLRTIYEKEDCDAGELLEVNKKCPPLHPLRLREEAASALSRLIERPVLNYADLRKADLSGEDLRDAQLLYADLRVHAEITSHFCSLPAMGSVGGAQLKR